MVHIIRKNMLHIVLAISLGATVGSLFFSEVLNYAPCVLCWFQRIFMYPLVFISFTALMHRDLSARKYILPLALTGTLIALYQNLLVWKIIPEKLAPCVGGVSCTTTYINWLGFITIPFLSLCTFLIISIVTFISKQK